MVEYIPKSVSIFHGETKEAKAAVDKIVDDFRARTTTVLALGTGAVAFFGVSDAPRHDELYGAALVAYALAVLVALWIFAPKMTRLNIAYDTAAAIESRGADITPDWLEWQYALGTQTAIREGIVRNVRISWAFIGVVVLTGLVVVLAGSSLISAPEPTPADPTQIEIISEGEHL